MDWAKRLVIAILVLLAILTLLAGNKQRAAAQSPTRKSVIQVPYTEYEWWLISWADNTIQCRILLDHEGLPTGKDVNAGCGKDLYGQWQATPLCNVTDKKKDTTVCEGLYLHQVSSQSKQKEVIVDLPLPVVWINLDGCAPSPPENRCATIPSLLLTGDEPLPNERITAIHGIVAGNPFYCEGAICKVPLFPTTLEGASIEFWADSSYHDTSDHFTAQVRVIDTGVASTPGSGGWYVDVISSQWQGAPIASCARIWQAFPPVGGPPDWLSTPDSSAIMASGDAYYYLAGRLITQGLVDASKCLTGGMLPNGYADACGLEKARPIVDKWQNQFDERMIEVAKQTGVPAQLMKNLFAQESQFWPGVFRVPFEFGLGQITDNGVDPILLWNSDFFNQFCPLELSPEACKGGYLHLDATSKAILRGALSLQAKSDCKDCSTGVDLTNVDFSVSLFANTLQANCSQVNQTIRTATKRNPGSVASYEDLWRLTVANYHAGPGCVSYAIYQTWQSSGVLNWELVSTRFTEPCKGVVPYVEKITHVEKP